jgi:hypothetical protein
VPLVISEDVARAVYDSVGEGSGERKELEAWRVRGERLMQTARMLAVEGTISSVGSIRALVAPKLARTPTTYRIPRTIRRIYERMLADVPVLQATTTGNGSQVWSLARKKGWEPPEASEEDKRWIGGIPSG